MIKALSAVAVAACDAAALEYHFIVGETKESAGRVSQEDINLILSTLKPTEAARPPAGR
jgi:hypothetical protein